MGIGRPDIELLIHLRQRGCIPLNRHVAEIGAQQLSNGFLGSVDSVRKLEMLFEAEPFLMPPPAPSTLSPEGQELQRGDAPFARDFWISLGFDYTAIDVDGSPSTIPLDLNFDSVPTALRHKFGLVTNFGTTEHVCNQLNAFKIIHDLCTPGAVMIHHLPAGGMLNHGLVNYTPKFFWHLARSNEYKWLYMGFNGADHHYSIPGNVLDFTETFDPETTRKMRSRHISDYSLRIAFQKVLDIPFVPPIDVNTGMRTTDMSLNRRYWTVLKPEILESVMRGEKIPEWILRQGNADS